MYLLFDLDGTLIDPFKRLYIIYQRLAKKYSLATLSLKHYVITKRKKTAEPFYVNSKEKSLKLDYKQERQTLLERIELLKHDTIFKHAKKILKHLKIHHTLILVTVRKNRGSLLDQLGWLGLDSYFSSIYSPYTYESHKNPQEIKYKLIMRFICDYPEERRIVLIGDTEADILAAKKMRIPIIVIAHGLRTKKYLKALQPDYLIDNLQQLTSVIEKLEKEG